MKIDNKLLKKVLGYKYDLKTSFNGLGLASEGNKENILSFLDSESFYSHIVENPNISGVFITKELKNKFKFKKKIYLICDDPRYNYYTLYNYIAEKNYKKKKSKINRSANLSRKSFISPFNVEIGKKVTIEPNVSILPDVKIGDNCIIRAGAVLGTVGFEHKKTRRGILSVFHDGMVILGENVEVGANTCIDKGFSSRHTIIGDGTKIDDLVYIAHSVQIGKNCLIIANATIMGSVTIKDNVWVGPSSTIAPQIIVESGGFITLGSVVTKNVNENEWVTGNFAIPHDKFIANLKKQI